MNPNQNLSFTKSKRFQLMIALIVAGMDFFHLGIVYPLFAEMVIPSSHALASNSDNWQRSLLYAALIGAFPFGQCIGSPLLGKLSDSFGRRRLLFITVIGSALGMAACALGVLLSLSSIILAGRLFGGLMGANLSLAYAAIADLSTPQTKVKNLSLIPLTTSIGFVLGPLMVGLLEENPITQAFGPSLPLWIAFFLSVINGGLLFFYEESTPISSTLKPGHSEAKRPRLFREKRLRGPIAVAFLMISANFLLVQYAGPYSINKLHADLKEVSWLFVNISVSVAAGHLLLTRKLASFFSPQKILPWSLGALACALFAASQTDSLLGFHISLSFVMLCCAVAYTNIFAYLSNHAKPDQQGEIMGLGVSVQCLAEWIPPLAVGVFALAFPELPLLFGSLSCIAAIFILVVEKRKNKYIIENKIDLNLNF